LKEMLLRRIPGFRSGSKIKALIASVFYLFLLLVVLLIIVPTPPESPEPSPTTEPTPSPEVRGEQTEEILEEALVVRVIDGDTIEVEGDKKLRYIGIDAPESLDCYSQESSLKNKELVEGKRVKLEKDVSETDKYERLLRYVYIDGLMVNQELVRLGYAIAVSYPPDVKYQDQLREAEKEAKDNHRGLWGACISPSPTPTSMPTPVSTPIPTIQPTSPPTQVPTEVPIFQPTPTPTPTPIPTSPPTPQPTQTPVATQPGGSGCKYPCDGPDRDCSDFATHAEAQEFFNCCGFSATYDPMRLDGWGNKVDDGIACESLP
jgi:micrococcal nuclease